MGVRGIEFDVVGSVGFMPKGLEGFRIGLSEA